MGVLWSLGAILSIFTVLLLVIFIGPLTSTFSMLLFIWIRNYKQLTFHAFLDIILSNN